MTSPELTRRELFRKSLVLAGLAAGGRVLAACTPEVREPGRLLSKARFATLAAVADTVVPRGGAFAAGAADADVAGRLDARMAGEPRAVQSQLTAALTLVEYLAVVYEGRMFGNLGAAQRENFLRSLQTSRVETLRLVAQGLSRGVLFTFYDTDASWTDIGYEGPWVAKVTP